MTMNNELLDIREKLVSVSTDPMKTKDLLDIMTNIVNEEYVKATKFIVPEEDVIDTMDCGDYVLYKCRTGYVLHFRGGYTIKTDMKNIVACNALSLLMEHDDVFGDDSEMLDSVNLAKEAIRMTFQLPMFVFSNPEVTYTIAEAATRYLLLLQRMGAVPLKESENPEYDKFLKDMNELMENLAAGLEKEGREYEQRNNISHEYKKDKVESESQRKVETQQKGS